MLSLAEVSYHPANPFCWQYSSIFASSVTIPCFGWSLYKYLYNLNKVMKAANKITLLASKMQGIGLPSGRTTFESKSCFHLITASKVALRVTSNTMKAPTASL